MTGLRARALAGAAGLAAFAAACASVAPEAEPSPTTPAEAAPAAPAEPVATFAALPGWEDAAFEGALAALLRSCPRFDALADGPLSDHNGRVEDWRAACNIAESVDAADAAAVRAFFESAFTLSPLAIEGESVGLVTAYFEPEVEASRVEGAPFVEPILAPPADYVAEITTEPNGERTVVRYQRGDDGTLRPYPTRAEILAGDYEAFAWGRVSDVVFLQIQGSGRLRFTDGTAARAAYAAHNGRNYLSIVRILIDNGVLDEANASNDRARAWLDSVPLEEARAMLALNERYVFFDEQPIADASIGPAGGAAVPLTAQTSIAVDPTIHPYGSLYWIAPEGEGAPPPLLAVAQDTGGAIHGPLRADIFFGSGALAGARADNIRHNAHWWALTPRPAADLAED